MTPASVLDVPLWTLKDPLRVTIPVVNEENAKPEQDVWTILCEEQIKSDNDKCKGWKDEIRNLLVFASLFSAVVTTFVVDSYKNIQPDSQALTVTLLAQLVSQVAPNGHNNSISTDPIPPFVPDRSEVRVNVYWFLSLVLSLGTALGGITTLQWIREFQHYDPDLPSKDAFAMRNLRAESFKNWQVPTIIATLPFLIQISLVLFLVGLCDFLFNSVSRAVAIPSTIVSGIIILFLVVSIILPTLQHIALLSGVFNKDIPTPCPYRSPPGWYFFRTATFVLARVLTISRTIGATVYFVVELLFPKKSPLWEQRQKREGGFWSVCKDIFRRHFVRGAFTKGQNTTLYDEPWASEAEWLAYRDYYSTLDGLEKMTHRKLRESIEPINNYRATSSQKQPVEYDAARGLALMVARGFRRQTAPYALYNGFRELSQRVNGASFFSRMCDTSGRPRNGVETLYDHPSEEVLREENLMFFLNWVEETRTASLKHGLWDHQLELCVRVLGGIFTATKDSPVLKTNIQQNSTLDNTSSDLWLPRLLADKKELRRLVDLENGEMIWEQLLLVFENFIVSSKEVRPLALVNIYHTFHQIVPFTELAGRLIQDALFASKRRDLMNSGGSGPVGEERGGRTKSGRRDCFSVVETTGTNINNLFIDFLSTEFGQGSPERVDIPFHKTTLYLTSTIYIVNIFSTLKDEFGFSNLQQVRDKMASTNPRFISSFINLMGTWVKKSRGIPGADEETLFGHRRFLYEKRKEVAQMCMRPGGVEGLHWHSGGFEDAHVPPSNGSTVLGLSGVPNGNHEDEVHEGDLEEGRSRRPNS